MSLSIVYVLINIYICAYITHILKHTHIHIYTKYNERREAIDLKVRLLRRGLRQGNSGTTPLTQCPNLARGDHVPSNS